MDVLVVRVGEITLKSERVRKRLERKLLYNSLEALGDLTISYELEPGRLFFYVKDPEEGAKRLSKVFGIVGIGIAKEYRLPSRSLSGIKYLAPKIVEDFRIVPPFAVRVKRVGEHEFTSIDAARIIGAAFKELGYEVNLENPATVIRVEIRNDRVFVYTKEVPGPGGLPLGTEGSAIGLISGGIDSPVAARYTMRRGVLVHFLHGRPVNSEEYLERVKQIVEILRSRAIGERPKFFIADLREFVEAVGRKFRNMTTVLVKRRLLRIAEELAEKLDAKAAVLGDSIGQVASQTLANMYAIDYGAKLVILRPLAGFDKNEIASMAAKIGTLKISEKHEERAARYARKMLTRVPIELIEKAEKELESIETPIIEEL